MNRFISGPHRQLDSGGFVGYFEISVVGSDTASDLNWSVRRERDVKKSLDILRAGLTERQTRWNTHGSVNVALVLVSGAGLWRFREERRNLASPFRKTYRRLVSDTLRALAAYRQVTAGTDWPDAESKAYHLGEYDKLIAALKRLIWRSLRR